MAFCDRCGSSSQDRDGFCGGCGAPMLVYQFAPAPAAPPKAQSQNRPLERMMANFTPVPLEPLRKNPWVAGLLAAFMGPMGMIYSTPTGAHVMAVVSVVVFFIRGPLFWLAWLAWPVCIVWAVLAARDF